MKIILLFIGIACSLSLVGMQYVAAIQAPWTLDVSLTNPPFGVKNVRVEVRTPFGSTYYKIINWQEQVNIQGAGGPIHVYFTIPSNVIPLHYRYEVWTYNLNDLVVILFPHKEFFYHTYEPTEHVFIDVK